MYYICNDSSCDSTALLRLPYKIESDSYEYAVVIQEYNARGGEGDRIRERCTFYCKWSKTSVAEGLKDVREKVEKEIENACVRSRHCLGPVLPYHICWHETALIATENVE